MPNITSPLDICLILGAILCAGATLAVSLTPPTPAHPIAADDLMTTLDDDGDGVLSQDEYRVHSDGELPFAILDADGSLALERWELDLALSHISPLQPQQNLLQRVR